MGKNPREKAEKQLKRAEQLFNVKQFKKAGRYFNSAGDLFTKLHDFNVAKDCFFKAAKCFLNNNKYIQVLEAIRNAGAASLLNDDFLEAYDFYKNTIKYTPYLRSAGEKNYNFILFGALSYLCLFIIGQQDKGLSYLKEIKKKVDNTFFKENPLISLVKDLTVAIRDKNKQYLENVEQNFEKYKFREAEESLVKKVLVLAKTHISILTELNLDKEHYTTKDTIYLGLKIDTNPLIEISEYPFYNYKIDELKIKNIGLTLSDNLTAQKKPDLPIMLKPGKNYDFDFVIKPHFQIDNPFIGPILLTCELDEKLIFFLKTQALKPNLISPPPTLNISTKNLRPPLIGQSFPMEILIENKSDGEALDINIEVDFPEKLKIMRGTIKKQIYSLRPNEKMTWELSVKPIEAGDYDIKIDIKFKDPDQNLIEETKNFPFSIKL